MHILNYLLKKLLREDKLFLAKITKNKALESQAALGEGDIPIAAVIGGILGIHLGISAIFLAALLALLPALYNLISNSSKSMETH